jgi:seryl-tRNA synthetase
MSAADFDSAQFYDGLVANRLIQPTGVDGAFGRGGVFEDVLERLNCLLDELAAQDRAEKMTFPPVMSRDVLEQVEYLESFPHLAGVVHSFEGDEAKARELTDRLKNKGKWGGLFEQTALALTPAACYPVYPSLAGTLPRGGRTISMTNWVFRNEPSKEPTRMQAFRVRELVRVGSQDEVVVWRDQWLQRGLRLMTSLRLPASTEVASDPFFGRGGRFLAANQRDLKLKFEILVPVISAKHPTACCSFNCHHDKFAQKFDIRTQDGAIANTACVGFGLERCVMALFQTHGFDPAKWPEEVRLMLWKRSAPLS